MSSTGPVGVSNEVLERAFKRELENNRDPSVVVDIYNMGSASQRVSLIKLFNSDRETLLHLLANQILNNQEEEKDTKYLMDRTFEILKTKELKKDLKDIVTVKDAENFSFLDFAVFCRNEKFNFVYQILKLIPKEDRTGCKRKVNSKEFKDELESEDINTLLGFFHLSNNKTSLTKKRGPKDATLLHVLGMQIIKNQEEKQDTSNLMDITLKILKTKTLKENLKNLVTAVDEEGQCFLDYAVLCRSEKLNFMDEILKLIPIEDRDECLRFIFQKKLKSEELSTALVLFYRSKDSEKASLAKIPGLKNQTLLQMLVMRIFQDLRKNGASELLEQPIEVLKQIDPNDIKEIANLQNPQGRTVFHLAALCKYQDYNLLCELLKIIPPQDRVTCLETPDFLQGWSPLHCKANATTHEDDLNERSIQEILDLLPSPEHKQAVKEIPDRSARTYIEIQEKKKRDEEFRNADDPTRDAYRREILKSGVKAIIKEQERTKRRGLDLKFLNARRRRAQSAPVLPKLPPRGMTVADFGGRRRAEEELVAPSKEPIKEPERPKTPPQNYLDSLETSIGDLLK